MIRAVLFDLDGTLLYTLPDMAAALNHALAESGLPELTTAEVRSMVGSGVPNLVRRAAPAGTAEETQRKIVDAYQCYYGEHRSDHTAPYPGIEELLRELKKRGILTAVITNKLHEDAAPMIQGFFGSLIDRTEGKKEGRERKPDPAAVRDALSALGAEPGEALYVGDSGVDAETGKNARMGTLLVSWGYRDEEELRTLPALGILHTPGELLGYLSSEEEETP